jgi:hypothetical protein
MSGKGEMSFLGLPLRSFSPVCRRTDRSIEIIDARDRRIDVFYEREFDDHHARNFDGSFALRP